MDNKEVKKAFELRRKLISAGLENLLDDLVYMPEIPMIGLKKEFMIVEYYGVKVAKLIGISEE